MPTGSLLPLLAAATPARWTLPPAALSALSAVALLLLLAHRRANLGLAAAFWFLAASSGYGWLRAVAIQTLATAHLAGAPYRLSAPLLNVAGVPLQELLGWTLAVGLASYLADRLLRRAGQPTDAYRVALVAGLGLAATCLVVESAAVVGGWWSWSLAHGPTSLLPFPGIALIDWGFVAIDFLLPFELWRRRAPLVQRLLSLLAFPVHLAGHALNNRWPGPLPLSGFDVAHVGLVAAVLAAALAADDASPWPPVRAEAQRIGPLGAVTILVATAVTQLLLVGQTSLVWTAAPLLAVAVYVATLRAEPSPRGWHLAPARAAWWFVGLLMVGLALRLPAAYQARDFERSIRRAAELLVAKQPVAAREPLRQALALRPDHPEALWLLGWAELQQGERAAARRHLEAALAQKPDAAAAAQLLAILNRETGAQR